MMLMFIALMAGCDLLEGQACNLMYAPDTLNLTLTNVDLSEEGEYTFRAEGNDGDVIECTLDPSEAFGDCGASGSMLSAEGSTVEFQLWAYAPDSVTVQMLVDDSARYSDTITPKYDEDEPNGPGCGFRRYGEVTVDFSGG